MKMLLLLLLMMMMTTTNRRKRRGRGRGRVRGERKYNDTCKLGKAPEPRSNMEPAFE
jgi:hypothetical protein